MRGIAPYINLVESRRRKTLKPCVRFTTDLYLPRYMFQRKQILIWSLFIAPNKHEPNQSQPSLPVLYRALANPALFGTLYIGAKVQTKVEALQLSSSCNQSFIESLELQLLDSKKRNFSLYYWREQKYLSCNVISIR